MPAKGGTIVSSAGTLCTQEHVVDGKERHLSAWVCSCLSLCVVSPGLHGPARLPDDRYRFIFAQRSAAVSNTEMWVQIKEAGNAPKDGVMVCGDSGNDVELFAVPGVRGCMVVNAHDELKDWCNAHASPQIFQVRWPLRMVIHIGYKLVLPNSCSMGTHPLLSGTE